jgi:hypothetical protein
LLSVLLRLISHDLAVAVVAAVAAAKKRRKE